MAGSAGRAQLRGLTSNRHAGRPGRNAVRAFAFAGSSRSKSGMRPRTDPRSPVQPAKANPAVVIAVALAVIAAAWSLSDAWLVGTLAADRPGEGHLPSTVEGSLQGLVRPSDYPAEALDRNEQGSVRVRLEIDKRGSVQRCNILSSSGSGSLDRTTCRIFSQRARFTPARDSNGNAISGTFSQTVTWRLAELPGSTQ